jgi:tetratricopeptide (TPR) repeat protein
MRCELHNDKQAQALLAQAKVDCENDQYREAITAYEHLLECHTDIINRWFLEESLGLAYYNVGEYEKAELYLVAAIKAISGHKGHKLNKMVIYDNLGRTNYRKYDYHLALEYFEKAKPYLGLYRGRNWAFSKYLYHLFKGRCHYELMQYQEALEEFQYAQKAVLVQKVCPAVVEDKNIITIEMGRTQERLENYDKAQELYESVNASELDTYWRSQLKFGLFTLYVTQKKYDAALKEFEELEAAGMEDIDKAGAYYVLGKLYFRQGKHDKARENFNKSLNIPTEYEWIHRGCRVYLNDIDSLN